MTRLPYEQMTPTMKAQHDFANGGGQDDNPYSRDTQREDFDAYAWAMHECWAKEFAAERQQDKHSQPETDDDNGRSSRAEPAADSGKPPF